MCPDERYILPPKEQAAKDRVYAYLSVHAAPIMDVLHTMSLKETAAKFTDNPQVCSMGKILWITAVREIFDQTQPGGMSPVGSWQSIDEMRMMAAADIRLQVAGYISDIWQDKEGVAVDCQIAINKLITEGLKEICGGMDGPHYLGQCMSDMLVAAMDGLIVSHECFGEDGVQPDKDRLKVALEDNANAYEPEVRWAKDDEDVVVSGSKRIVRNFERIVTEMKEEVESV